MPAHAVGLKKYRSGTLTSRTVDKEHATATLGDAEMLTVESAPLGATELSKGNTSVRPSEGGTQNVSSHQERENRGEVSPTVAAVCAWDVLPNSAPWE